ncbi:hypothetical protein EZS27_011635 [termite gut metagenome]|uniref:Uncharacterized protein n=1 Tax=termite gut metagenome TaxID=433724 RepID=A0A5J4S364_9ZZZZ
MELYEPFITKTGSTLVKKQENSMENERTSDFPISTTILCDSVPLCSIPFSTFHYESVPSTGIGL